MPSNAQVGKENNELTRNLMLNLNSSRVETTNQQGKIERRSRLPGEFIESMRTEWIFYPGFEAAELYYHETKGKYFLGEAKYEEAISNFTQGINIAEKHGFDKADCLVGRGNSRDLLFYEIRTKQGYEPNKERLKELMQQTNEDYAIAVKLANTVYSIEGASAYYLHASSPRNYTISEELLQRGLNIAPYKCEFHLMLSEVYLKTSQPEKAKESLHVGIGLFALRSGESQDYQSRMQAQIDRVSSELR